MRQNRNRSQVGWAALSRPGGLVNVDKPAHEVRLDHGHDCSASRCKGSARQSAASANDALPNGLTNDEAHRRLEKFGPNAMPDTAFHPLRMALEKLWAPVPWMLEAAIVL